MGEDSLSHMLGGGRMEREEWEEEREKNLL